MGAAQLGEQMAEITDEDSHRVDVQVSATVDQSGERMLQIGQITGAVSGLAGCVAAIAGMIINERLPFASDSEGHFSFSFPEAGAVTYLISFIIATRCTWVLDNIEEK